MREIASRTGWAALGLVPFFDGARRLPAEDAYDLTAIATSARQRQHQGRGAATPPHRQFRRSRSARVRRRHRARSWSSAGARFPLCDLIVLPGSKATIADLATCAAKAGTSTSPRMCGTAAACLGFAADIRCSGKASPTRTASKAGPARWPGLACSTSRPTISGEKTLEEIEGFTLRDGVPVHGYEMHMGRSDGPGYDVAADPLQQTARRMAQFRPTAASPALICMVFQ